MNSLSSLQCAICLNKYDLEKCLPKILPQCGHTICLKCLSELLSNLDQRCPLDKNQLGVEFKRAEEFPTNYSLKQIVEEKQEWDTCQIHNERSKLVCIDDKKKICSGCLSTGSHRNHLIKPLTAMQSDVDARKVQMEQALSNLDIYHLEINNRFKEVKNGLQKFVEKTFRELNYSILQKRMELLLEIDSFFQQERSRSDSMIGKGSQLRNTIVEKISSYKVHINKLNISDFLEEDLEEFTSNLEAEELQAHLNKLNESLDQASGAFKQGLLKEIASLTKPFSPLNRFIEYFGDLYPESDVKGDEMVVEENDSVNEMTELEVVNSVEVKVKKENNTGIVEVLRGSKENNKPSMRINLKEIKDIQEIVFNFQRVNFTKEEIIVLSKVCRELDGADVVKIHADYQETILEDHLVDLFPNIFGRSGALHTFEITFRGSKVHNETLLLLFETILPKANNLQRLKLDLTKTDIRDSTFQVLSQELLPKLNKLEELLLLVIETKLSNLVLTDFFGRIPLFLKTLFLGLGSTNINDDGLMVFVENVLPLMTNLESLQLGFWNAQFQDESLRRLLMNIPNVKTLALGLRNTQISNATLKRFLEERLQRMTMLRKFEIILDGTPISETMKLQVRKLKASLNI